MAVEKKSSKNSKSPQVRRSSIRFKPDMGDYAQVDAKAAKLSDKFNPTLPALIVEESSKGCGLVIIRANILKEGQRCKVKVGRGPVLLAIVKWVKPLDKEVSRFGFQFLE